MFLLTHLWIILALPLLGSAINGLFGKAFSKPLVNTFAVGSVALAFLAAAEAVREFFLLAPAQIPFVKSYFTWMVGGEATAHPFRVDFAVQIDQLTVVMLMVVTFVGMLIH